MRAPVHGAAMMPPTRPMPNAPAGPSPPTVVSLPCTSDGKLSSNAPNIDAAIARKTIAMGMTTSGFASWAPKPWPASAATTPSPAYIAPIPLTYAEARPSARTRETFSLRAPKRLTVMGMSG
jgi:hypothetical protein